MARGSVSPILAQQSPARKVLFAEENPLVSSRIIDSSVVKEIPKAYLPTILFALNISWMLIGSFQVLFHVYMSRKYANHKGILIICIFVYNMLISVPTFYYLTSFKKLLQQTFLLDTMLVSTSVAVVAFYSLMEIFDNPPEWQFKAMKSCFCLQMILYVTMIRVMLVRMEWTKWRVIAFKLHLMINGLMYFVCGVYFIVVNWTYTKNKVKNFDAKVHDFMVMFLFGMFGCFYEFFNKISELDFTGMFKYVYKIKNVDENYFLKQQEIRKKRAQSIKSFRLIVEDMSLVSQANEELLKEQEK